MKAAPFRYARPTSVRDICELLATPDEQITVVAGGQTLIPMMAMRLARPSLLVDINWTKALSGIRTSDEWVAILACTRQAQAERSQDIAAHVPLLKKALRHVGHPPTRARGTVGGSLANADPAAEIGLVAAILGASIKLTRLDGEMCTSRTQVTSDFIFGPMETTREEVELLEEIRFPIWSTAARVGVGFEEVAVRDGDFALVAAGAQIALDADGICQRVAFGVTNAAPRPLCGGPGALNSLVGTHLSDHDIQAAAHSIDAAIDPPEDAHASARYRRHLVPRLITRALQQARDDANMVRKNS